MSSEPPVNLLPLPLNRHKYPHLLDTIISLAERDSLVSLRATSKVMRDRCDARLARHVAIHPSSPPKTDNQSLASNEQVPSGGQYLSFNTPSSTHVPGLGNRRIKSPNWAKPGPWGLDIPLNSADDVPLPMRRILAFIQIVDIPRTEEIATAIAALAPYMTSLRVLRITDNGTSKHLTWPRALRARVTVLWAVLDNVDPTPLPNEPGVWNTRVTDDRVILQPSLQLPEGTETLLVNVYLYHHYHFTYTAKAGPNAWGETPYPTSLQDVIINAGLADRKGKVDSFLWATMVESLFDPHQLNTVKYTILGGKDMKGTPQDYRDTLAHMSKLAAHHSGLPIEKAASALQVSFISHAEYNKSIRWPTKDLYYDTDFDDGQLEYNGWVLVADPYFVRQVQELETAFLKLAAPFACNGCLPLTGPLDAVALYFKSSDGKTTSSVSLPLGEKDVNAIYEAGSQSPFGLGKELKYDESYRCARELKPPHFAVSSDPLIQADILGAVQRAMDSTHLVATVSKLNAYPKGGFFKPHRDTPRGDLHLGTLTLCLPSTFEGGDLIVRHGGESVTYNWATEVFRDGKPSIAWAFLYSDCEHEVLPVTSGTRITIAYDVFTQPQDAILHGPCDSGSARLDNLLRSSLRDPLFLPNGGILGFGLQHSYPQGVNESSFLAELKGTDAVWVRALAAAGIQREFVAIYDDVESHDYNSEREKVTYKGRLMFASRDFYLMEDAYIGDDYDAPDMGLDLAYDATWVTEPGAYGLENHYISYGNEPEASTQYVAVGVLAYVGPPGKRDQVEVPK